MLEMGPTPTDMPFFQDQPHRLTTLNLLLRGATQRFPTGSSSHRASLSYSISYACDKDPLYDVVASVARLETLLLFEALIPPLPHSPLVSTCILLLARGSDSKCLATVRLHS